MLASGSSMVPVKAGVLSLVVLSLMVTEGAPVSRVVVSVTVPVFPAASVTVMVTVSSPSARPDRSCPVTVRLPLLSVLIAELGTVIVVTPSLMVMLSTVAPASTTPERVTLVASLALTSSSPPSLNAMLFAPSPVVGALVSITKVPVDVPLLPVASVAVTVTW